MKSLYQALSSEHCNYNVSDDIRMTQINDAHMSRQMYYDMA